MSPLPWLEDFNDPPPQRALPEPEPEPDPLPEPIPDPRLEGWHEGFIAGHRQAILEAGQRRPPIAAALIQRLEQLDTQLQEIAANSAAQMGGLLIEMLAKAAPETWDAALREKLGQVIEAVLPSFHLEPALRLHTPLGFVGFRDLPGFAKTLESLDDTDWAVTLHWDVEKPPDAVLPDLRAAIGDQPLG
jgi:hypothetical protein